jgi:hypothetical protein
MIKTMFQDGEKGEVVSLGVKLGHLSSNNITQQLAQQEVLHIRIPNFHGIINLT